MITFHLVRRQLTSVIEFYINRLFFLMKCFYSSLSLVPGPQSVFFVASCLFDVLILFLVPLQLLYGTLFTDFDYNNLTNVFQV